MEDYPYPIVVEGDWKPEHKKSLKNKLLLYFQSKKKSQGGDCVSQIDETSNTATILFKSMDTRDDVLSKLDHMISIANDVIKLKVSKPGDVSGQPEKEKAFAHLELNQSVPPAGRDVELKNVQEENSGSCAVFLEGVPPDAGKDVLALLVENICSLSENDFSVAPIPELNAAVVTFKKPRVVGKFLEESRTHRKFQEKFGLKARVLERSSCVRVENLSAEANNKMLLELFFEKCGGPVEEVIVVPAEQAAIITFKKEEDKEKVLKMEHNICNAPVKVYPYYKSLTTAMYGSNRPTWKLPEPVSFRVHPAIREFLLKKGLLSFVSQEMDSHFCRVNMDQPEVLLSPDPSLLKQKGITQRHIDDWGTNASDTFRNIMFNYTAFEWQVLYSLWTKVERDIKVVVKDLVFIHMDASKGVLTLAGVAHDIIRLKPILMKMLEQASTQMERERNGVAEDVEMTPAMFSFLSQDGLKNATAACPQLRLHYNKNIKKLHLSGLQTEILTLKNWILEKKLNIKQKPLRTDRSLLEFLGTVDCVEMSTDLFMSYGISAVYTVENEDVILIASTEKALVEAEKRMKTALIFNSFPVEDLSVLKMPQWYDLNTQLQNLYNTYKKKAVFINFSRQRDKVIVSGFREPVNEVSQGLRNFLEEHSRTEDTVRLKSHAVVEFIKNKKSQDWKHFAKPDEVKVNFDLNRPCIKLTGERRFVQSALTSFKRMADNLHTDTLIIKKAGAKKYFQECKYMVSVLGRDRGFVVVLQEDHMLEEEEDHDKGSFENFVQLFCEVQMPGGVTVTVRIADICKFRVDAVVNAANEDLQHSGGVALALLQAAGPALQQFCDRHIRVKGPLRPGEAIITEAGRLPCKFVVHTVGPRYNSSDKPAVEHHLRSAVRESLKQASAKGCSSIAIPVISSGIFGCPLELCTETIALSVRQYIEDQKHSSKLTEIHLVDNNASTVKAMAQAVRKEFAAFSPKMSVPHHKQPQGYGGYKGRGQGNRGRGNQRYRNQELGDRSYEPRGRGKRDFEEQAQWREKTSDFSRSDTFHDLSVLETQTTQEGLKIVLNKGNIQDTSVDVIVNTISEDLDLSRGAISKSLFHTAGGGLQAEVKTAARAHRLNYGEMVVTDGYNLKCVKVFHVVCPFWRGGRASEVETLSRIMRDCLKRAETLQMTSLSFPAIGTGNLGYPKDLVARTMMRELQEFSPRTLREVSVIVHPSDGESLDCFTSVCRQELQGPVTRAAHQHFMPKTKPSGKSAQASVSTSSLGVVSMQVGPVNLEVSSGDISKENTDAIVNSSNQTFTLKSGVSKAILDAAGLQVEQECVQIASAPNFQQTEIVTSSGQLPCKNIIHIVGRNSPDEIKEVVLSVLKLCEANQLSSVAFPALGTGQGGANPAAVADAMVDAVVDFVKKTKPGKVKLVKFLIFQSSMVADFHQSMLRRSGEKVEKDRSFFDKFKDRTKELFWGESSRNEEFVMAVEEFEPSVFQLCGKTPQDLKEAKEMINSLIMKECLNTTIRDPAIGRFTKKDAEILSTMQRELSVSINLERRDQAAVITLEGLTKDVHSAESQIRDMIRKVERDENRRQQALMFSTVVEWQYQDSGQNYKCFEMLTSYDLEEAFRNKNLSVKIKIDDEEYSVSLSRLEATRGKKQIKLKRVEVSAAQSSLPSHWEDMMGQSVVVVPLSAGSKEYTDVKTEFSKTGLTCQIIEIERIQNCTLWKNYMIKKDELKAKNNHKNNEKLLFHGTGPENTDQINHHGFNRSYAGINGAMYGNGTYFAVDPQYSAQGYAKTDSKGHKRMYLARVLVGDFTQGKQGLLAPPARSSSGVDLYNSVTDDTNNPKMFVIFSDVQAYPEFLITFQ